MKATSKFLSLILRHKPQTIGLELDEHGWADVSELCRRVRGLDFATLEQIVAHDDKRRYSFSADKRLIRANQGHSIPVDVELEEVKPPEVLYHGTAQRFSSSINAQGLLKMSRLYVHLSNDVATAEKVGRRHGQAKIFLVESGKMFADGYKFFRSVNGVWLTEHVPAKYLKEMF
ncbi:MAG: RNA 2'-phosphotransferase [Selenomonadaceae bacterium]|nr:RNA 2'-phosphotransferase [Selenomonadaceae bacterium]